MTASERRHDAWESRKTLIIVIAVGAAILIAGFFYILMRASSRGPATAERLQGAIRPGSPEFAQFKEKIILDEPEADEARRPLGDIVMTLRTTVRNLTDRTLSGLEIRAAVVDGNGKAVKERTVVVIPSSRAQELAKNKTLLVPVTLEGMSESDYRANISMEITAFKFKD